MTQRQLYDTFGSGYSTHRRPDPRVAAAIDAAIGAADSVLNVGAGTGSYEPAGTRVFAVEPSTIMIQQRPAGAAPVVRAVAENLPFADRSVDVVTAFLTVHHWTDRARGLAECTRVADRRVVLLTWTPGADRLWLVEDYFPEFKELDRATFPSMDELSGVLGDLRIIVVPIPADCTDGFAGAYWRRPAAYLDPAVRAGISSFARIDPTEGLRRLREDLESGRWERRYASLLERESLDLGYRVVVAERSQ